MMVEGKPGRGADQFPLRLPDGMRERIKDAAGMNNRSMNAEIVERLKGSFELAGLDLTQAELGVLVQNFRETLAISEQQSAALQAAAANEAELNERLANMTEALNSATDGMNRLMDNFLQREKELQAENHRLESEVAQLTALMKNAKAGELEAANGAGVDALRTELGEMKMALSVFNSVIRKAAKGDERSLQAILKVVRETEGEKEE